MAKFVVPLHELPPPMSDGTQKFRFRIITEDRNVVSYWSPIFKIVNNNQIVPMVPSFSASAIYDNRTDSVSISLATDYVTDDHTEFLDNYDIFVNWDNNGYEFYNRMNANGINIANEGISTVKVKGQYPSQYVNNQAVETNLLKVFETDTLSLVDLRDTASISASVSNISASVTQINENVANVEGLIYALS